MVDDATHEVTRRAMMVVIVVVVMVALVVDADSMHRLLRVTALVMVVMSLNFGLRRLLVRRELLEANDHR